MKDTKSKCIKFQVSPYNVSQSCKFLSLKWNYLKVHKSPNYNIQIIWVFSKYERDKGNDINKTQIFNKWDPHKIFKLFEYLANVNETKEMT